MTVCPQVLAPVILPQADASKDAPPLDATNPGNAETATVSDTPEDEASLQNGVEEELPMPPNLETFIPGECLPDVIDVYIDDDFIQNICDVYSTYDMRFTVQQPIKLVRQYPPCGGERGSGNFNGSKPSDDIPDCDCPKGKVLTGQLDLRHSELLGVGHHSKVVLAPLTFSSTPSVRRAVAVKTSLPYASHEMLLNEAKIYNAFPRNLQDGDAPTVPKFYGYYVHSTEVFDWDYGNNCVDNPLAVMWDRNRTDMLNTVTSILLLEACGKPVDTNSLALSHREDIAKLLKRLHGANFVQGSFYDRNILVQPGPLTLPYAERRSTEPSYRIIDFGRGLGLDVNCSSHRDICTEAKEERRSGRHRHLIP